MVYDFCFKLDDNRGLFVADKEIEDGIEIVHGCRYYHDTYCLESDIDIPITFFVKNEITLASINKGIVSFDKQFLLDHRCDITCFIKQN